IEEMLDAQALAEGPELNFWLNDYQIRRVKTVRELPVVTQSRKVFKRDGLFKNVLLNTVTNTLTNQAPGPARPTGIIMEQIMYGGVKTMALALRLRAGDSTALR